MPDKTTQSTDMGLLHGPTWKSPESTYKVALSVIWRFQAILAKQAFGGFLSWELRTFQDRRPQVVSRLEVSISIMPQWHVYELYCKGKFSEISVTLANKLQHHGSPKSVDLQG